MIPHFHELFKAQNTYGGPETIVLFCVELKAKYISKFLEYTANC
jgi:hypothetical protein